MSLTTALGSTKDTKRQEDLKRYNKTVIHQTGHTIYCAVLFVIFVLFVDSCFFWDEKCRGKAGESGAGDPNQRVLMIIFPSCVGV